MNNVIKVLQQVSDTCSATKYCARCDMFNDATGVCVFADMPYLWDFEKLEEALKRSEYNER